MHHFRREIASRAEYTRIQITLGFLISNSFQALVVSIGGNDVALAPSPCTVASILGLVCCLPSVCTDKGTSCGTVPVRFESCRRPALFY